MSKEIERVSALYDDISIGPDFNSRKQLRNIEELADSIDENGLVNPLTVREGGPARTDGKRKFFLVAGERRYRAIGVLRERHPTKYRTVEVKLVKGNTQEIAALNLIENLQRENLDPLEEADAMQLYMAQFKLTQAQLAKKLGKSEPYISQRLSLRNNTAPGVKAALEKGEITPTHAREIVTLSVDKQEEVLSVIKERKAQGKKVSVQDVKEEADRHKAAQGGNKRGRKNTSPVFDDEKVKAAKEIYAGQAIDVRPKTAFLEQLGGLANRAQRATSDATKAATKAQVAALEWALGLRDAL